MTVASVENREQVEYWNGRTGSNWAGYQDALDRCFGPVTARLLEAAAPAAGERVLDVGCGCGATTIALAERVGPRGHVLGVDVSAPMLAVARARAPQNVELRAADAAEAELPAVDLVTSRFGVMFFADPVRAFSHLRAAGGRLAFVCWRPSVENAWHRVTTAAVAPYVVAEPPAPPGAPGPFSLSDPDRLRAVLDGAGWREVAIEAFDASLRWTTTPDLDGALDLFTHIGPASRRLAEAAPDDRARGTTALREALAGHLGPEGVFFDSAMWVVTARP